MIIDMKINKYTGIIMMAAALLTSCSDFDDYNKADIDVQTATASQTIWENISQNDRLKDFAALVKAAGFDQALNTTHCYTVWAPLDGTYDAARLRALGNEALLKQFVKNHIAEYTHGASGSIDERVLMLNAKSYDFKGNGTYEFDGVKVQEADPSCNGVIYLIEGQASYLPNIYEYITDSLLSGDAGIDSLRRYVMKAELSYLDEDASHKGPIVDGMQTYIDSVVVTYNPIWDQLNTYMTLEDSSYTFLMPTNKAWNGAYDRIKSHFNYGKTLTVQNFNGTTATTVTAPAIDPAYWQDSLTSSYLLRYLSYSNNDGYNLWLDGRTSPYGTDTLRTTLNTKLSDPQNMLAQTVATVPMSNGIARIVDSLAFYSWETFCRPMFVSTNSSANRAREYQGTVQAVRVDYPDPSKVDLSNVLPNQRVSTTYSYTWMDPSGPSAKPELNIYLHNVQSTTYDIYCIFVPETVDLLKRNAEVRPNRVIFTLNYCDENGKLQNKEFLNQTPENEQDVLDRIAQWKEENPGVSAAAPDAKTKAAFTNDVTKVDTVYVGEFTFPVSYYGLDKENTNYCPNLKISSPFNVFNKALMAIYARELRIGGILLIPKEYGEYVKSSNNE